MNENQKTILITIFVLSVYLIWRMMNFSSEGFKSKQNSNTKDKESFHEITNIHSDLESFDKLNKLCTAVELQDKIKQEKMKLEKTKQYYLKSQQQQDEIMKLKAEIEKLQSVRNDRIKSNDQLKLAKYEQLSAVEEKMRQQMLDRIKQQKSLDVEVIAKPYRATDLVVDKVNTTV